MGQANVGAWASRNLRRFGRLSVLPGLVILCASCTSLPKSSTFHSSQPTSRSVVASPNRSTTTVGTAAVCMPSQLTGTVAFNAAGSELGAIKLTNNSNAACSLSGQPTVKVLGDNGNPLAQTESVFHRAPDWPPPTSPIVLSPSGQLPQAIVELDWVWCETPPHKLEFQVRFSTWSSQLDLPGTSISPSGFSPHSCSSSGSNALFAVDYVRGLGPNGIIGPS
jgi:hypothetical protein